MFHTNVCVKCLYEDDVKKFTLEKRKRAAGGGRSVRGSLDLSSVVDYCPGH